MRTLTALLMSAALGLAAGAATARAGDTSLAQEAVFGRPHLDNVAQPRTLRYTFRRTGTMLPAVADQIEVEVTAIRPDGRKEIALRLFSGPNLRAIEPAQAFRNNPLIVAFLQRDVEQMSRMTGGSAQYFRNRIRAAFDDPAAVDAEPVEVTLGDRQVAATRVTVEPFTRDPNLIRFQEYARKRYEFVLAAAVPGGVARLSALTPAPSGEPLLDEVIAYDGRD